MKMKKRMSTMKILEEEAENPVDSPGNDFNEIEEEIDEEVQ